MTDPLALHRRGFGNDPTRNEIATRVARIRAADSTIEWREALGQHWLVRAPDSGEPIELIGACFAPEFLVALNSVDIQQLRW